MGWPAGWEQLELVERVAVEVLTDVWKNGLFETFYGVSGARKRLLFSKIELVRITGTILICFGEFLMGIGLIAVQARG